MVDRIIATGLTGAISYGAIGALLGFGYKLLEQAREDYKTDKDKMLEKYSKLKMDVKISKPLGEVLVFASVSPNWIEPFCKHLEFVCACWEIFYQLDGVGDEQQLVGFVTKYLPQYAVTSSKDHQKHDMIKIKKYEVLDEIESLLDDVLTSRSCMTALMAELVGLVKLFNVYWDQVGSIIMEDEYDNEYKSIEDLWDEKLDMFEHVTGKGGRLLYKPKDVHLHQLDHIQKQYIAWWMIMHCAHQPSMRKIAKLKKLNSIYNPAVESPRERQSSTPSGHRPKPVHANSTTLNKAKYYMDRVRYDGLKDTIDEPKRSQQPAIHEACYLPTVILKQQKLITHLKSLVTVIDSKISFMVSVHTKLRSNIFTNAHSQGNRMIASTWQQIAQLLPQ